MSERAAGTWNSQVDKQTFAGPQIISALDSFAKPLTNSRFEELNELGLGKQIDVACWELAQQGADRSASPTLDRAIKLRSLHALYSLENYLADSNVTESWDYMLSVYENPFWQAVDKTLEQFIFELAVTKYDQTLDNVDIVPALPEEKERTVVIGEIAKKRVAKKLRFAACRNTLSVVYLAQPTN